MDIEALMGPSVLTSRQFEAIGRLAFAINELEHTITQYTTFLLGDDPDIPALGFTRKTKFLRKGLMVRDRPGWHAEILRTLDKADALAQKRHDYMHALVVHDFVTNQAHLKILSRASRRSEIPDPAAIVNLASEAYALAGYFTVQCENLLTERDNGYGDETL